MKVFGPVPSRRLGYSLGVDPVPFKTCTLDCLYCQLGPTPEKTLERKEYVPLNEILDELKEKLQEDERVDYITLSGSGEPTLHSGIGEIIRATKKMTEIPVAVLTNGTLLHDPAVRQALSAADLVVPSLDAGCEETFLRVNRPHHGLSFEKMTRGMEEFSRTYTGKIWLEVMLLAGINDSPGELEHIAAILRRIKPDKVQLNTVARPPSSEEARPLTKSDLEKAQRLLEKLLPGIPVEVITAFHGEKRAEMKTDIEKTILGYLKRRPATLEDLSTALGLHRNEIIKYLEQLYRSGTVEKKAIEEKDYFVYRDGK